MEEFNDEFNIVDVNLTLEDIEAEEAMLQEMEDEVTKNNIDPDSPFKEGLNEWSDLPVEEFLKEKIGVIRPGSHKQTSFYSRPLKITGTTVSSQKENKERWGIILNHLIVNKPPDVSSKPTEKRGLLLSTNSPQQR